MTILAIQLATWRSAIADLYSDVRHAPRDQRKTAWDEWRKTRDVLFASHAQTPLTAAQLTSFSSIGYFAYDSAWCKMGRIVPIATTTMTPRTVPLPEGSLTMRQVAHVVFDHAAVSYQLALYWLDGYGGGLFLPFGDGTNGGETYGGGRYLYDTIKGADLGIMGDRLWLDFNFAYNPSCAYNAQWVCPLTPPENCLPLSIKAGELAFGYG